MNSRSDVEDRPPGAAMPLRRKIFFSLVMVLLVLLSVELGLQGVALILSSGKVLAHRESHHASPPWAIERLPEFYKDFSVYEPFIVWRAKEFSGKYINVSPDGVRRTFNPSFANVGDVKKVFCFGGSTMWGGGARDEFTIPSLLSKKLNQDKPHIEVTNYAQCAYTLTQEVVYLSLLLKRGKIPDFVIFYDGVNDTASTYMSGEPGKIHSLRKIRGMMGSRRTGLLRRFADYFQEHCMIYRALATLRGLLNQQARCDGHGYSAEKIQSLSDAIIADYVKNVKWVEGLSKGFGFRYVFFWQPMLYTDATPTKEELAIENSDDQGMVDFFRLTYKKAEKIQLPHFHNISKALDSEPGTLYTDYAHLREEGNEVVADEMCKVFRKESGE